MKTISTPVKGDKPFDKKETPLDALEEFYNAFNNCKMELMQNNWANTPEIAMDNPLGGIMRGWDNIKEVYSRLFNGSAKVYVEFYDYSIHELQNTFYVVGRERGYFQIGNNRIELAIRTSRIFQKNNGEWKQVHHHGSIENPELLKEYQSLVKSN